MFQWRRFQFFDKGMHSHLILLEQLTDEDEKTPMALFQVVSVLIHVSRILPQLAVQVGEGN